VHAFAHALTPFATPEAQLLIRRIGEIANMGRSAPAPQAAARPSAPVAAPAPKVPAYLAHADEPLDQDDARTAFRPMDAPAVSPGYAANASPSAPAPAEEASPLERTLFMGGDYVAPSPVSPAAAQPQRPAPAASPPGRFNPAGMGAPHQPVPAPNAPAPFAFPKLLPGADPPPQPAPAEPPQRELLASHPLAHLPAGVQTTVHSASVPGGFAGAAKPPVRAQKLALAAVAGAVVLLSIVAVLVVFKGRSAPADATALASSEATSGTPAASAAVKASPSPAASSSPSPAPKASSAPTASAEPAAPKVASGGSRSPAPAKVDPPPDPTPSPGGSDDTGTLVAVSVGGACAFSLNGESKGTTSAIRVSNLKPGTYSVTCAPASGPSKSKSVTVTGGGTATVTFKP
jgi:eukaryotic-like serine/threonine-protein kinase